MNNPSISIAGVGTYLTPTPACIKEFVTHLKSSCIAAPTNGREALVAAHNAMTLYTLQMLVFATGHRAVSDPFFDLGIFDLHNQIVLIEDKVVSAAHQARISWLPNLAITQFSNYISHLRSLSRYLRQHDSTFADQIWAVTEPDYPHPFPLFFFMEDKNDNLDWVHIQPSSVEAMLGSSWILPQNTNRHLLSTWLHRNGCPPEAIDAQLGHIEAGCSPFSGRSPLAPETTGELVIPFLDTYLKEQGWVDLAGLKAPSRLPICRPSINSKYLVPSATFGPQARTLERENTLRKDAEAVLALIKDRFSVHPPKIIPDRDIDELQDQIVNGSPDGRILIRLTLFRRHLIKLKRAGITVKVPGRLALANKEPSYFDCNSYRAASIAERVRNQFISYLASQCKTCPDHERRIAEILISSVLFGAQSSPVFLKSIATGIGKCTYRIGENVIVDVASSAESPIRRWMPDEVSLPLILGYWKHIENYSAAPVPDKINQYLVDILHLINVTQRKIKSRKRNPAKELDCDLLSALFHISRAWWRFRLPGAIRGYAEGENPCASVPLSNWLRVLTEKSGTLDSPENLPQKNVSYDDIHPIRQLRHDSNYRQAKDFWDEINKALGPQGKNRSGSADARSNGKKSSIESLVLELLNDSAKVFPPVAGLIASWLVHLCRHGTSHKPKLAASSVVKYGRTIGEKLISMAYDVEFLSLPDLMLEEIYRNVLDTASDQNRGYVAARLKEFHSFLVNDYAMPDVDWSEVVDDDLLEAEVVDAGIVTLKEYTIALNNLFVSKSYTERDRLRYFAFLFFAYRFGLRTGEIARLAVSDVILNDGDMVVYIRNSFRGETKSENGVRQLPLIGPLSDNEHLLIQRWLLHVDTFAEGDALSTLFPKLAGQRDLLDRNLCVRAVVELLRTATGDNQIRLRHLRHTCATRIYLAMMIDKVPAGPLGSIYKVLWNDVTPKKIRKILVGDSRLTRRGLFALALFMGHASPDVTHRHYVHLADIILKEWIGKVPAAMDGKALSYAYQTTYDNVRQAKSRFGNELSLTALSAHFTRQTAIPSPKLGTFIQPDDEANFPRRSQSLPPPADIDRLLSLATMRDSIDGLADRFLTTVDVVGSVLLSASTLQERTGFTGFAIPQTKSDDYWIPNTVQRQESLDKESKRVRRFLEIIRNTPLDTSEFNSAIQIWQGAYHPHLNYLVINKRSELVQLLDALTKFGIPAKDFEALIPEAQNEDEREILASVEQWLSSQGLPVHRKKRMPHSSSKFNPYNRIGLMLRASKSHQLGYQRTLNRALFITSVWLQLSGTYAAELNL